MFITGSMLNGRMQRLTEHVSKVFSTSSENLRIWKACTPSATAAEPCIRASCS